MDNSVPTVSVLMCTNVDNAWVDDALSSILAQTFRDFEVILVANGMSDDAFTSLEGRCIDTRIRLFRTEVTGLTFSLNLGLHHSRALLISRMDADDIAYHDRLERQVSFMQENPDVTICGSACDLIDECGNVTGSRRNPLHNDSIRRTLRFSNPFCHPSIIVRRAALLEVGGYDGNGGAEDYELWLRLAENGKIVFRNLPDNLLGYRVPATGTARKSRRAYRHVSAAQYRAFLRSGNPIWLCGAALTVIKMILRASRA